MAAAAEIAAMAERVIAPEPTLALLVDLYAAGTKTCTDAAKLLEWHIDERAVFGRAVADERAEVKRLERVCDELVARLNRIGDHLRTLTVYAEGDNDHTPPCDPWPEAQKRGRKA